MADETKIVLFDGICNLCNGTVQFIIKRDPEGKFKFAALQSQAGQRQLEKFGLPLDYMESFIYIRGDKLYKKSSAVLNVLRDMGGFWTLISGLRVVPAFVRNIFYDIVGKTRYTLFGKQDSCMIPTPDLQKRFLV